MTMHNARSRHLSLAQFNRKPEFYAVPPARPAKTKKTAPVERRNAGATAAFLSFTGYCLGVFACAAMVYIIIILAFCL